MHEHGPQTYALIGAAMAVHAELGPGFLEPVYQEALEIEFADKGIPFQREVQLPVNYKGRALVTFYRVDFICYGNILVELKALKTITGTEESILLNYLKATGYERGLLLSFGAPAYR